MVKLGYWIGLTNHSVDCPTPAVDFFSCKKKCCVEDKRSHDRTLFLIEIVCIYCPEVTLIVQEKPSCFSFKRSFEDAD